MAFDHEEFWRRWAPFRHGDPGGGNFADVMRVLRLHENFAAWSVDQLERLEGGGDGGVTVLDLACGAAQLAGPLDRALKKRGRALLRYVGVDFADRDWMEARVGRELARNGLEGRGEYVHHDLAQGLPPGLDLRLGAEGSLLVTSCWGITYLPRPALVEAVRQTARLAAGWPGGRGGVLSVNGTTGGELDRGTLTRRFLTQIVPAHLWEAARGLDLEPARRISLALRGLPGMRQFGAELKEGQALLPAADLLALLEEAGHPPDAVDGTALWGQMTCVSIRLPAG